MGNKIIKYINPNNKINLLYTEFVASFKKNIFYSFIYIYINRNYERYYFVLYYNRVFNIT